MANRSMNDNRLSVLPTELLFCVTAFLDSASLLKISLLDKHYCRLSKTNDAGWKKLCQDLWKDKVFHPNIVDDSANYYDAYRISLQDARNRHHIFLDELLFDIDSEQGTIWNFRFKETAGPDWTSWDPWYNGKPARQMILLRDGQVKQYLSKDVDPSQDLLMAPNAHGGVQLRGGARIVDPPVVMAWRFASQPMDLPDRPQGSYIRFSVGERDVPTYCVRRSPTGNWGFLAESCWGVYTSFQMPRRKERNAPNGMRLRRTSSGNRWLPVDALEEDNDDGDGDTEISEAVPGVTLTDDSAFIITNEVQWREALLYNFGATLLPEGQNATADFDRMFGQHLTPQDLAAATQQIADAAGALGPGVLQQAQAQAQAQLAQLQAQAQAQPQAQLQQELLAQAQAQQPQNPMDESDEMQVDSQS